MTPQRVEGGGSTDTDLQLQWATAAIWRPVRTAETVKGYPTRWTPAEHGPIGKSGRQASSASDEA